MCDYCSKCGQVYGIFGIVDDYVFVKYEYPFLMIAFYEIADKMVKILHLNELRNKYDWMNADDPVLCDSCIDYYYEQRQIFQIHTAYNSHRYHSNYSECCSFCLSEENTYMIQTESSDLNNDFPIKYYYICDANYRRYYFEKLHPTIEPDITVICDDCLETLIHFGDIKLRIETPPYSIPPNFVYNEFTYRDSDVLFPHEYFERKYTEYYKFMNVQKLRKLVLDDISRLS